MPSLRYKSISLMKLQKDNVNSPFPQEKMNLVVNKLKDLGVTHLECSVPLDYPDYALKWCNTIHGAGLKVLFRGTWNQIEGLYGQTKLVGPLRPVNAMAFWLDKTIDYINTNSGLFVDGDLWGPLPERTEGIFQDVTSFLPYDGLGIQINYADFFNQLVDKSKVAFQSIGKNVEVGMTANNFTEVDSGWIQQSVFDKAGVLVVDHYQRDPIKMYDDIKRIYSKRGKKVFLQEWQNIWDSDFQTNLNNCKIMYDTFKKLIDEDILISYSDWSGWP